jgi:hypothetical protein
LKQIARHGAVVHSPLQNHLRFDRAQDDDGGTVVASKAVCCGRPGFRLHKVDFRFLIRG